MLPNMDLITFGLLLDINRLNVKRRKEKILIRNDVKRNPVKSLLPG
jgi:hypothetical protein